MSRRALVIGAGGAVGEATALALAADGWRVTGSMRTRRDDVIERLARAGVSALFHDIVRDGEWIDAARDADAVVFATHLKVSATALTNAEDVSDRIVAFSSNNVAIHPEAPTYRALADAERAIQARYPNAAIIRPTLIYGDPRLPTVPRILRMTHSWPIIPMPGSGAAKLEPVFHEDLGRLAAGLASQSEGGVYAAGGPDVITMRDLFAAAREVAGGRGVIVPVPALALTLAAPILSAAGAFSSEQAARADHDRRAVAQTPLPPALAPRTDIKTGLTRLWAAMRAAA